MSNTDRARLETAALHLRGTLVATPILGDPWLPGVGFATGLRIKVERLQVSGSAAFRGAMYALGRRLGSTPVIRVAGREAHLLACATAAALQRVACTVFGPVRPALAARLVALGAVLDEAGGAVSFHEDDPDYAVGLATLGLELGRELPGDVDSVHITDWLAPAVLRGLAAAGRPIEVVAAAPRCDAGLRRMAGDGLRVRADPEGLGALASALAAAGREALTVCVL